MELMPHIRADQRTKYTRLVYPRHAPRGTSLLSSRLVTHLAGIVLVLACLALPLVLGKLAMAMDEATKERAIQALRVAVIPSPSTMPETQPGGRADLLNRYYYFVSGCVAPPGACVSTIPENWGEYYAELRTLYEQAAKSTAGTQAPVFADWAGEHAPLILSTSAPAGALIIAQRLAENHTTGDIHMVGTSAGGTAIVNYLSRAMRGEIVLDRRIRSVLLVDAPLGAHTAVLGDDIISEAWDALVASGIKSDVQAGLGEWARAANNNILTVDTWQDMVGHDPLPNVTNDDHPTYLQADAPPPPTYPTCTSLLCRLAYLPEFLNLGSTWHIYTGSHMASSVRQFIDQYWR